MWDFRRKQKKIVWSSFIISQHKVRMGGGLESIHCKKGPCSFPPFISLASREKLKHQKLTRWHWNGKDSSIGSNKSEVQQHMPRTFMYLGHAMYLPVFLFSTTQCCSVPVFVELINDDHLPLPLLLVNFFMPCMLLLMWINQLRHSHERGGRGVNLRKNTSRGCLSA
jgi:hypothetical protein